MNHPDKDEAPKTKHSSPKSPTSVTYCGINAVQMEVGKLHITQYFKCSDLDPITWEIRIHFQSLLLLLS